MHLLLGQAAERIGNIPVGYLERLFHALAEDHIRQHRTGRDGAGATKGFKTGLLDDAVAGNPQIEPEGVATGKAADLANGVGVVKASGIVRMQKMIVNSVSIVPHDDLLEQVAFRAERF